MTTKKSKKKASVKPLKSELFFELDGHVYIVEKKDGKVVSRDELDGKLVLQSIVSVLSEELN